jgi:hypothetical protein
MMILVILFIYILCGAAIGAAYYYLQLKEDKYNKDAFVAVCTGLFWPVVAPFTFAFFLAEKMSKRK